MVVLFSFNSILSWSATALRDNFFTLIMIRHGLREVPVVKTSEARFLGKEKMMTLFKALTER